MPLHRRPRNKLKWTSGGFLPLPRLSFEGGAKPARGYGTENTVSVTLFPPPRMSPAPAPKRSKHVDTEHVPIVFVHPNGQPNMMRWSQQMDLYETLATMNLQRATGWFLRPCISTRTTQGHALSAVID